MKPAFVILIILCSLITVARGSLPATEEEIDYRLAAGQLDSGQAALLRECLSEPVYPFSEGWGRLEEIAAHFGYSCSFPSPEDMASLLLSDSLSRESIARRWPCLRDFSPYYELHSYGYRRGELRLHTRADPHNGGEYMTLYSSISSPEGVTYSQRCLVDSGGIFFQRRLLEISKGSHLEVQAGNFSLPGRPLLWSGLYVPGGERRFGGGSFLYPSKRRFNGVFAAWKQNAGEVQGFASLYPDEIISGGQVQYDAPFCSVQSGFFIPRRGDQLYYLDIGPSRRRFSFLYDPRYGRWALRGRRIKRGSPGTLSADVLYRQEGFFSRYSRLGSFAAQADDTADVLVCRLYSSLYYRTATLFAETEGTVIPAAGEEFRSAAGLRWRGPVTLSGRYSYRYRDGVRDNGSLLKTHKADLSADWGITNTLTVEGDVSVRFAEYQWVSGRCREALEIAPASFGVVLAAALQTIIRHDEDPVHAGRISLRTPDHDAGSSTLSLKIPLSEKEEGVVLYGTIRFLL
ncbi:MAG: hypothetical protein ACQEQV_01600 [Fibrobacterota bacterium]